MLQELPAPGTSTEMYLAAILDELRGLRADCARPEPPEGTVELRESHRPAGATTRRRRG